VCDSVGIAVREISRLFLLYIFFWFIAFSVVSGFSFDLIWKYFYWGWIGGGELPVYVNLAALSAVGLILALRAVIALYGFVYNWFVYRRR
jgi:hypothetical protein